MKDEVDCVLLIIFDVRYLKQQMSTVGHMYYHGKKEQTVDLMVFEHLKANLE